VTSVCLQFSFNVFKPPCADTIKKDSKMSIPFSISSLLFSPRFFTRSYLQQILSWEEKAIVFSNIDEIYDLHRVFLASLGSSLSSQSSLSSRFSLFPTCMYPVCTLTSQYSLTHDCLTQTIAAHVLPTQRSATHQALK